MPQAASLKRGTASKEWVAKKRAKKKIEREKKEARKESGLSGHPT
jgi:hypothetical protein